jgi:hypothetical protein
MAQNRDLWLRGEVYDKLIDAPYHVHDGLEI